MAFHSFPLIFVSLMYFKGVGVGGRWFFKELNDYVRGKISLQLKRQSSGI